MTFRNYSLRLVGGFFFLLVLILSVNGQSPRSYTLSYQDTEREYLLHLPKDYDGETDLPLLLCFHGYTSAAEKIARYSGFCEIADQEGFVAVFPQGTLLEGKTHWNVGGWTLKSKTDDLGFARTLLDTLTSRYAIDTDRIYSTGMSNGGYMSFLLACQMSDRIAAVASVTGSMTPQIYDACDPQHPMPVLQMHATTDQTVPYEGNQLWTQSIEEVIGYWRQFNDINTDPVITQLPDLDPEDGSTVISYLYRHPERAVEVRHYKVLNGGHDWFGARGNKDIEAAEIIWDFLSRYSLAKSSDH